MLKSLFGYSAPRVWGHMIYPNEIYSLTISQAGDRYDFTGTLIVVPDVGSLSLPGAKAELTTRTKLSNEGQMEGIKGLKALGVRELHYK